jgi:hypothetical protein
VTVTPSAATLPAGQTQQFAASVSGSTAGVAWSINPAVGSISASGFYTAPASIALAQTVTVTAASVDDPSKSASAAITLQATVSTTPSFTPVRINTGGAAYVDPQGQTWSGDTSFSGGSIISVTRNISGTKAAALYQNARTGQFTYSVAVPNGAYAVNLKFAELVRGAKRNFNVAINGAAVLANFDIAAEAGAFTAIDKSFPATVTNGRIAIALTNGMAGAPLVNAIEVTAAGTNAAAPSTSPDPVVTQPVSVPAVRVNAGGPNYADGSGLLWSADNGFSGGSVWSTAAGIASTTAPALYQTQRWGEFAYRFAVPNGSYLVTLKFSETSQLGIGQRLFNVAINGAPALTNFDIFAQAGGFNALDKTFAVTVSNGLIDIAFTAGAVNWPEVNGIEIAADNGVATPAASPLRTQGGTRTAPATRSR